MTTSAEAKYINPPNILKQKAGRGGIPVKLVEQAQQIIAKNTLDFAPYADSLLQNLLHTLDEHSKKRVDDKQAIGDLACCIMQLKANGGMFNYHLVSGASDAVLLMLDNISELNDDARNILHALHNSLTIIVGNRLKGHGGREGKMLETELQEACQRFYKKYDIKPE